jgi:methionyl-tRNA synthetase
LNGFSLTRAADLIGLHTDRLRHESSGLMAELAAADRDACRRRLGDLFSELLTLIAAASPILVDLAEAAGSVPPPTAGAFRTDVRPFPVPLLRSPS